MVCRSLAAWLVAVAFATPARAAPSLVASREDAFVAHAAGSTEWTIGSGSFTLSIGLDSTGVLKVGPAADSATGRAWALSGDVAVTLGGQRIRLGDPAATSLLSADATSTADTVQLAVSFQHRATRSRITQVYACAPGSPTIEQWTRIEAPAGVAVMASDITAVNLLMPNARVRWLTGLRDDSANSASGDAFTLGQRDLEPGETLQIGTSRRSSSDFVPFVTVDNGEDEFYSGLIWSGSWQIAVDRVGDAMRMVASLPGVQTDVSGRTVDLPHAFYGVRSQSARDDAGALLRFIVRDLRHSRPFTPLVTYNTWFPYGTRITEDIVAAEMQRAAAIGVEVFVVDAGWYLGAGANGDYDYTSGLGTWTLDAERFPSGLAALADEAHGAGMKFGLWVEPERVSLDTVDRRGLAREAWLSTRDGHYSSDDSALICLGTSAARQWVLDQLTTLIEVSHADYLKWDNNLWVDCNRERHDHGPSDGSMAHVQGLYSILTQLRSQYPDLLIENVSGGGNRLDFGMLSYTDVGWMDDRSSPSSQVRHNLEGLTFAFPPAYLLSFVVDSDSESIDGNGDPAHVMRSRMPGVLGLSYQASEVAGDELNSMIREIGVYKSLRSTTSGSHSTLLSDQAPVSDTGWDVLQELSPDGLSLVVFAFKASNDYGRVVVRPRGLDPAAIYAVTSIDDGPLGATTGTSLMTDGIELFHMSGSSLAHVLVLSAGAAPSPESAGGHNARHRR